VKKVYVVVDKYVLSAFDSLDEAKTFAQFLDFGKGDNDKLSVIHSLYIYKKAQELINRE